MYRFVSVVVRAKAKAQWLTLYRNADYANAVAELKSRLLEMFLLESDVTPWEESDRNGLPGFVGNVLLNDKEPENGNLPDLIYYSQT